MESPLPLKNVVLFIAVGTLCFVLVFILIKRQITRFALKSRSGPHIPIGTNLPKKLRQEIERRLKRVGEIKYEPVLIEGRANAENPPLYFDNKVSHYYYRMKAVDLLKKLESEILCYDSTSVRRADMSLRIYLMEQQQGGGALQGINSQTVEKLFHLYEQARHETLEFREKEYKEYELLLNQTLAHIRNKIKKGDNKKTFPFHIGDSVFYCPQATDNVPLIGKPTQLNYRGSKLTYGGVESSKAVDSHFVKAC